MLNIKKGAMFGLDARIALAIFGALSVISGAALYSAIQQAKVVSLVQDFREIAKALEAMYLDTGSVPNGQNSTSPSLDADEFLSSTSSGWKGPYLNYTVSSSNISHSLGRIYIRTIDFDSRTTVANVPVGVWDSADMPIGIHLWDSIDVNMFVAIDNEFDGGDGPILGSWQGSQTDNNTALLDMSKDVKLIYRPFIKNLYN
tara:strand:+ start:220 stop:822 length:603 start_codon:yes stop_codon:yes gene_type:complete